jgi:RNA polymerase sigma-70 factor (ECF subfamily)
MASHEDYDRFIRPIEGQMLRSIWRILHHSQDSEDALQDVLRQIWESRERVFAHPNPSALILRMCIQSAHDRLRRRLSLEHLGQEEWRPEIIANCTTAHEARPPNELLRRELRDRILMEIARLPAQQAAAVAMRLLEQMPYPDIASALGCAEATVRVHVMRGREQLMRALAEHDERTPSEKHHA